MYKSCPQHNTKFFLSIPLLFSSGHGSLRLCRNKRKHQQRSGSVGIPRVVPPGTYTSRWQCKPPVLFVSVNLLVLWLSHFRYSTLLFMSCAVSVWLWVKRNAFHKSDWHVGAGERLGFEKHGRMCVGSCHSGHLFTPTPCLAPHEKSCWGHLILSLPHMLL